MEKSPKTILLITFLVQVAKSQLNTVTQLETQTQSFFNADDNAGGNAVDSDDTDTEPTCLFCSSTINSTSFNDCLSGDIITNVTVPDGFSPICSTTVVYSGLASSYSSPQNMVMEQVIRSIPTLQLEYERRVLGGDLNSTGAVCSAIGDILKCTAMCYGHNCNYESIEPLNQITPYQQLCTTCTEVEGSAQFNGCLSGSNTTLEDVGQIAMTHNQGDNFASDMLSGMCVTIVNYNSSGSPVAVSRKASGVSSTLLPLPKNLNFTSLGQCGMASDTIRGDQVDTMTCVEGTLAFLNLDKNNRPNTYSNVMPAPSPTTSCFSCSAMGNEVNFEYCNSPSNFTDQELFDNGVQVSYCPLPIDRKDNSEKPASNCFVMSLYSEDGTAVLGIQRGCVPPAYFTYPDNAPSSCYNGNEHVVNVNQTKVCISQCTTNSTTGACNDYENIYSMHTSGTLFVSSSIFVLLTSYLL